MDNITSQVLSLLDIPFRLQNVVAAYVIALMVEAPKRTLTFAAAVSGLHKSQFSRLLSDHAALALASLKLLGIQAARQAAIDKCPLVNGAPWTIAIIIDATLHQRSSLHVHNAQRFNHGQGFVVGHQWTNIVVFINGQLIPLAPIAFLSKNECKRRGVPCKTEHEHLESYLANLSLSHIIGTYLPEEVVVLMDSGYDNKLLQRAVLEQGWDFVSALKSSRGVQTKFENSNSPKQWRSIANVFRAVRKQSPWKKIRIETDAKGKKRRKTFSARQLTGRIKGVFQDVILVCSEKAKGKGRRYFACSNIKANVGAILRVYRIRWQIELFHRAIKSQLGLMDAGVSDFAALTAHVHWVYCAWLLLPRITLGENPATLLEKQRRLSHELVREPFVTQIQEIMKARTQFGGVDRQKKLARAALRQKKAA